MKRLILVAIGISLFFLGMNQEYVPFPTSDIYWNEMELYQGLCDPPDFCRYTYFFDGDTVLNSISYHKLYSNDSSYITYKGGLRVQNKKVYFHEKYCSHEFLMYDFNLGVGDSILLPVALCDTTYPTTVYVTSIDSVLLEDMSYRRRINLNYYYPFSWIEGIGSDDGLLYPKFIGMACVCYSELVCFRHNDSFLFYNETNVPCFDYIVSENEIDEPEIKLSIFPNPSNNEITITNNSVVERYEVWIYSQAGQKALTIKSPTKTIDISALKPGLYFAEIKTSEGSIMKKIIVQ